jgi:transcriptional regulator with XRE-family HTH domain
MTKTVSTPREPDAKNAKLAEANRRVVEHFGTSLQRRALESGLTTKQLADRAGKHYDTVHKIAIGARSPQLDTLGDLATSLNMSIADLLTLPAEPA